jgi:hypothetical protein
VGGRGLAAAWPGYLEERYPAFRRLCRGLWEEISKGARAVVNWHELITECSNASAADREFQGCSAC